MYSLISSQRLASTSFQDSSKSIIPSWQSPTAPSTAVPTSVPPPSWLLHEAPLPLTTQPSEATSEATRCPLIKVSMLYGVHRFLELEEALGSHFEHCARWGCELAFLEEDITSRKLYSKHYFLLLTLLLELSKPAEERMEWLMWVDADSILINPAISPCAFLPPDKLSNVFALVTADHQGLNNGVFYLRVHKDSLDLLTQIADFPLAHPDEDLGWFGEQAAMERVIHSTEASSLSQGSAPGIAWVPRHWFNTFEFEHGFEGQPGDFIVHFAGLGGTRLSHMADWLAELQRNQAKWEMPLEQTSYADDIPRFWDEFAANATKYE